MKALLVVCGLVWATAAEAKPLASVPKFDGKFMWVKLGDMPTGTVTSLSKATWISIDVTFAHDVKVKKDGRGNTWFTFIVADQGKDWKWNQTSGNGGVKLAGDVIKAGHYTVSVPVKGIPSSVLHDKKQTISVGPSTSGIAAPAAFTIDRLSGR